MQAAQAAQWQTSKHRLFPAYAENGHTEGLEHAVFLEALDQVETSSGVERSSSEALGTSDVARAVRSWCCQGHRRIGPATEEPAFGFVVSWFCLVSEPEVWVPAARPSAKPWAAEGARFCQISSRGTSFCASWSLGCHVPPPWFFGQTWAVDPGVHGSRLFAHCPEPMRKARLWSRGLCLFLWRHRALALMEVVAARRRA